MNLKTENLTFGITLGFKLARMEFIWKSDFEFAKKEFENGKNELYYLIASDNIIPDESSYQSFSSSILNYYMRADIEIFYSILIGICIQRSLLIGSSKSESSNKEIEFLAKSSLKSIPDDIIPEKENFFEFVRSKKSPDFDLSNIIREIDCYLKQQHQNKQKTHIQKNDVRIFISYRRDGGDVTAKLICETLKNRGYSVFYDYDSLKGGVFDSKILEAINNCTDMILVLSKKALDRCKNENDWVRQEIKCALNGKKNIIPVMVDKFEFPKKLPKDIQEVTRYNGVRFHMDAFESVIDKIIEKLSPQISASTFNSTPGSASKTNTLIKTKSELRKFIRAVRYDDISTVIDNIPDHKQFISNHYPKDTTKGLYAYLNSAITQVEISNDTTTRLFLEGCLLGIILLREVSGNSENKQFIDNIINSMNYDYFAKQLAVEQNKMWKERILVYEGLYMIAMSKSNEYHKNGNAQAGTMWASVYLILAIIDSFLQN